MKIRMPLAALALVLLPTMAGAWNCGQKFEETAALSCAEGMALDPASGICVLNPTS